MSKLINLSGQRFGTLLVVSQSESRMDECGTSRPMWNVICDCGTNLQVVGRYLLRNTRKHCGSSYCKSIAETLPDNFVNRVTTPNGFLLEEK